MKQFSNYPYRISIILFTILTIVVLGVVIYVAVDFNTKSKERLKEQGYTSHFLEIETEAYFDKYYSILQALVELPCIKHKDTLACNVVFKELNTKFKNVVNFAALDREGYFFASGMYFNKSMQPSIRGLEFFEELSKGADRYIMSPHIGPISNEKVTGIIIPFYNQSGITEGFIGVSIRFSELERLWRRSTTKAKNPIIIADRTGTIHFALSPFDKFVNKKTVDIKGIAQIMGSSNIRFLSFNGDEYLLRAYEIKSSGLKIFELVPRYTFWGTYTNNYPQVIYFGAVVLIFFTAGAVFLLQNLMTTSKLEMAEKKSINMMQMIEHARFGIAVSNAETNLVEAANKAFADMYGYALEEIKKKNLKDLYAPEVHDELEYVLKMIHEKGFHSFETVHIKKDGTRFPVQVTATAIYDINGKITHRIVNVQDITEQKKTEEDLRITNEELLAINRIITTTTVASTAGVREVLEKVLDEVLNITGLEGGTICMVTPDKTLHLSAHRGTSEATIKDLTENIVKVGDCLCGKCARDYKPLILMNREEVLNFSTREATRGEDIRFHAAFPLIIGERCLGVLCVFTRTDKKPTERSLKLLETVTSQIAIAVDNAEMFEKITHQTAVLEDEVNKRTIDLKAGQQALISLVEDLEDKRRELEEANLRLKEVDRLKSIFIASMSHELRTPLNSVIGFSSILLNEWLGPLNQEQKETLSTILRSGKHLLALINDVIDVSKVEVGAIDIQLSDFDLYDLIIEAVKGFEKEARDKKLDLKVKPMHQMIHSDRRRLMQCIMNLVSNAIKFTESGSVSVVATICSCPKDGEHTDLLLQNFTEIIVEDTGIGIKQEDIPKLFNFFVRLESPLRAKVPGTGLGLYLTKKLVTEVLKGDIIVSSEYGKGSRFEIRIPL